MSAQNTAAPAPPDLLKKDEVMAIVLAVARYQAGPDGQAPPYPVPDLDRATRVVRWANRVRFMNSVLELVIDGRMLIDFLPERDDVVAVLAP